MSLISTNSVGEASLSIPRLRFTSFFEVNSIETLGNLVNIIDCKHRTPPYVEIGVPVVSPGSIKWGEIDLVTQKKRVSDEEYESLMDHCSPEVHDLVFSRNQSIGIASIITSKEKFVLGQDTVLIQAKDIDSLYNYYRLQTESVQNEIARLSGGSTFSRINLRDLRKLKYAVAPSLPEQQKIAAFLSAVDQKIQQLTRKKELLETYKKGLMQQLFSGDLRFKDEEGKSYPDWEEKRLGEVAKIYDGTHQTPKYVKKGIPFYSVEHLTANQFAKTKYISEEVFEKENKRVSLEKGDILMTRIGDVGTSRLIDWEVKASFYVSLALIKQHESFDSSFLNQYISSREFQSELWKRIIHVAFPKKINLGEIGKCKVRLPSMSEQIQISNFLAEFDTKITSISTQITQTQTFKKGLLQQMFV